MWDVCSPYAATSQNWKHGPYIMYSIAWEECQTAKGMQKMHKSGSWIPGSLNGAISATDCQC